MEKHFATSGFIVNESSTKLLMVYHKKLETWLIPGGHLEPDEEPVDGVIREVLEETGVSIKVIDASFLPGVVDSKKESAIPNPYLMLKEFIPEKGDKPAHIHIDFIFLGMADENEVIKKQEAEVNEVKWFDLSEVLEMDTFESIKKIARTVLEKGGVLKCVNSDL